MARVARIPQIEASQGLDTQRSTQPNIQVDMSPYVAQQKLGETISQAGAALAARMKQRQDEMEGYKTERAFQKFQNDVLLDQTQYDTEVDGSGENYLKDYQPRYDKIQSEFEAQVPERLKAQYAAKTENFKGQVQVGAARREVELRNHYYSTTLDSDTEGLASTVMQHPDMSADAWSQIQTNVEMSGLRPTEKAEKLNIYRKKIDEATVQGLSAAGRFDEARSYVQHLSPAIPYIPHDTSEKAATGKSAKVTVYEHVDYDRVKPFVRDTISSVSNELGIPLRVTSGYRSLEHPVEAKKRPGAFHRHTTGTAVDLDVKNYDAKTRYQIVRSLVAHGATGLGTYQNSPNMIHVDWSGLGAGVKKKGLSTWYSGQGNDFGAPQWFKDAYHAGLADRKMGNNKTVRPPDVSDIQVINPDKSTWGKRADGSNKGEGYLGVLQRPDGQVSSEISISTDAIGGKDFPLIVPTLTRDELDQILSIPVDDPKFFQKVPRSAIQKAEKFAEQRVKAGLSPFAGPQDRKTPVYDVVPNTLNTADWTLKNFQPWEFGDDASVDNFSAPVAVAFDNMTSSLGQKLSFKAKDNQIKVKVGGMSDAQKQEIILAAKTAGFNQMVGVTENGEVYLKMGMSDQPVSKNAIAPDIPGPEKNYVKIAGPNSHFVPRGSPDGDKLLEYIQRSEEKADREHEKAVKEAQNEVSKNAWTLIRNGQMSRDWLDKNIDNLSETDYRMITRQILADEKAKKENKEPKPYETDQSTFVSLMRRAVDPKDPEVVRDAIDAQSKNLISKADFNKVFDVNNKTITEGMLGKPSDWKPILRKYVTDKIIKSDDPEDTQYLDQRLGALFELDDWFKEHPDATRTEASKMANDILKKYNGAELEDRRANIGMTALPGVGRYDKITPQMLKQAASKVEADFKAGTISKDVRNARIKELSDWFTIINEESKNGR